MCRILFITLLIFLSACNNDDSHDNPDSDILLDTNHGGAGSAWGLADCDACHVLGVLHQNQPAIRDIVKDNGYETCTGCHGSNGTDVPRQCIVCHNDEDLPDSPIQSGLHKHDFNLTADNELLDKQCLDCHYASDMDGVFDNNRDLTRYADVNGVNSPYANGTDFCLRCHNRDHQQADFLIIDKIYDDPLIAIEDTYTYVDKHGEINSPGNGTYTGLRNSYIYSSRVECTDCHSMHGTNNKKLIIDQSNKGLSKLDLELRDLPHSVSVIGDDYSQLCVLCHDMEILQDEGNIDTGNGLAGVHLTGSSCIECHSHGEAIQAGL